MKKPFWQYRTELRADNFGLHWIESHLWDRVFRTKETITKYYNAGALRPGTSIEEVLAEMEKLGATIIKHHLSSRHMNPDWTLIWDDGAISIDYWAKNRGINVSLATVNQKVAVEIQRYFESIIVRVATKGRVFIVVSGASGPKLQEMGVAGEDFIPSNYRPETVVQYKHVVTDLNNSDPCGRIVLLDGPPGTGKTHMVRALLNEVPKATFILIPSNFISSLGEPSFLGLLTREQKKDSPLILILEDADEALVNRKEGNTSAISALLNFSDGIFGTLLDMRLICTTNVEISNLDPAVVRDGRLCTRMEIGLLDNAMANVIFERLTGKKGELKDKLYKLGTVYKIAKGNGLTLERETPKKSVGFSLGTSWRDIREARVGDEQVDTYERVGDKDVKVENPDYEEIEAEDDEYSFHKGMEGEPIIATDKDGNPVQVGHIDNNGQLVITDDAFLDDDDDLIDEDPDEDDANTMPDYMDEDKDE